MATISKNISNLATLYQVKIDALTDSIRKAEAQIALDAWKEAEQAYQDQVKTTAQSYTGPGMTVAKRTIDQQRRARDAALYDLQGCLGDGVSLVDMGGCL